MTYDEFFHLITDQIVPELQNHRGLAVFARNRSKFEGWLKVELVRCLSEEFPDVRPETNRLDVTFDNWAVELKTVNTNYRFPNVQNLTRPITRNVQGVIADTSKLRSSAAKNKAVVFIAFPVEHNHPDWQTQLERIKRHLRDLKHHQFFFLDNIPSVIYCGKV